MKAPQFGKFVMGALAMLGIGVGIDILGVNTIAQATAQSPNHVFELRTYHAMPGKLDDLNARFRNHTIEIFNRHHMKSIGYWIPQDNKDNVLIYILEHPSKEEGMKNWAAFRADPEWQQVSKASEANGKLVDHVDSVYMNPADFSPMK